MRSRSPLALSLRGIVLLVATLAALPAGGQSGVGAVPPTDAGSAAGDVLREAESFDRGNVRIDGTGWGKASTVILNAEKYPNFAEYDFEVKQAGTYDLYVKYAALTARPVVLSVDGKIVNPSACSQTTGSWKSETARWTLQGTVRLRPGRHTLRFERRIMIPHLDAWLLRRSPIQILDPGRLYLGRGHARLRIERALVPQAARVRAEVEPGGGQTAEVRLPSGDSVKCTVGYRIAREGRSTIVFVLSDEAGKIVYRSGRIEVMVEPVEQEVLHLRTRVTQALEALPKATLLGEGYRAALKRRLEDGRQELAELGRQAARREAMSAGDGAALAKRVQAAREHVGEAADLALVAAGELPTFLRKTGYYVLADNQATYCSWTCKRQGTNRKGPEVHAPGLVSLWSWPSKPVYRGIGNPLGVVSLERSGQPIALQLDTDASYWHPHLVHTEYVGEGVRLRQDVCLADDVAVCRIEREGTEEADLRVVITGHPLADGPAAEVHVPAASVVLKNADTQLQGQWQGLGSNLSPAEVETGAEQYVLRGSWPGGRLVLAGAIARERSLVERKLAAALVEPEAAFQAAHDKWREYLAEDVPRFLCSDGGLMELYYWVFYVLKADQYDLTGDTYYVHPYVVPSKWTWRGIWPEDLSHCLTGLRWLNDPEPAQNCLRMIFDKFFNPEADAKAKVHAYGLLTVATWEVFQRQGDRDFLARAFPVLCRMNEFLTEKLDTDGDHLVSMFDSFHLGWDSSLRFDYDDNLVDRRFFKRALEPIDANCYHQAQCARLADMAEVLGRAEQAAQFRKQAEATAAAIRKLMWDEETGFYYDIFADTHELSKVKSCAGLFPLLNSVATRAQADRLVKVLKNPEEFWRKYPVACVAKSEPISKTPIWTGSTVQRNNWLIAEGLARSGYEQEAAALIERALALSQHAGRGHVETGYYFDPDSGTAAAQELGTLFSTPLAGLVDMIIQRICGVVPRAGRTPAFRPLALDGRMRYLRLSGLRLPIGEVDVRWSRREEGDVWGDGEGGYRALVDGRVLAQAEDPKRVQSH